MKASDLKLMRGAALLILVLGMASMGAAVDELGEIPNTDNIVGDGDDWGIIFQANRNDPYTMSGYLPSETGMDLSSGTYTIHRMAGDGENSEEVLKTGSWSGKTGGEWVEMGDVSVSSGEYYGIEMVADSADMPRYDGEDDFVLDYLPKDTSPNADFTAVEVIDSGDWGGSFDYLGFVDYRFEIANEPPVFESTSVSPDPPVIDTSSDVSFEASDDNEVSEVEVDWFRDGTLQESQTNSYSSASVEDTINDFYTPSEQGEHIIYFTATDDEGESTTETLEYTEIEVSPIAWIEPSDGDTFTYQTPDEEADVNFEWEVDWDDEFTDGETRIQRLDDQDNFENLYTESQSLTGTETFITDIGLEEGTHEVRIYIEQNDGADTSVTDTRTITVEEETQEPEINLENPEDQAEINYPVEETDTDVSFEWVVEAFEEEGTTRLYLDDDEVFSDEFTATFASNPFENVEFLSEGSYEWYVEAETEDHLVTSETRTFTVSEQEIFVDFTLNSPEDNEIITFPFGDQASIDYDGAVSSNIEGEISLLRDSNVLASETHPGDASVSITAEEDLDEGLYDWNLEYDYEYQEQSVYDDFESGSISSEWEGDAIDAGYFEASSTNPIDGSFSGSFEVPSDSDDEFMETGSDTLAQNEFGLEIRHDNILGGTSGDETVIDLRASTDLRTGERTVGVLKFNDFDEEIIFEGDEGDNVLQTFDEGTVYSIDFDVNPNQDTVDISINDNSYTHDLNLGIVGSEQEEYEEMRYLIIGNTHSSDGVREVTIDNVYSQDLVEETESSNTFSFEVEEEDATPPEINLISPDEGEVFNLDPGQTNEDISFEWSVEAFEETGTTRLYVNNDEVFTDDFTATFASNSFSHSENLEEGTHEYYVEAETDSHTVTSDTRTFELNERSMDVPEFTLTRPEDGERLNAGGDSSSEVDFEFAVSAETDGEIGLEVLKPGESDYVNVYNDDYSTGVSQSYNPNVTLEDIEYPNQVNSINESDSYDWRLTFDSTETDDSFTSDSQSFTFTTEEITTAQGIVDRVLNFFRGYWEALMDGTSTTGKAFMGLVLMLAAGAIGFAAAGSVGAGFGMAAMFLVNTLVSLFPGWIVLALVIGGLAYVLIMRGD